MQKGRGNRTKKSESGEENWAICACVFMVHSYVGQFYTPEREICKSDIIMHLALGDAFLVFLVLVFVVLIFRNKAISQHQGTE